VLFRSPISCVLGFLRGSSSKIAISWAPAIGVCLLSQSEYIGLWRVKTLRPTKGQKHDVECTPTPGPDDGRGHFRAGRTAGAETGAASDTAAPAGRNPDSGPCRRGEPS